MGIKPDPGTFNDTCQRCFPVNETPQLLKVFLADIKTGDWWIPGFPPAPNGYFDFLQAPGQPCQFEVSIVGFEGVLKWEVGSSFLEMSVLHPGVAFKNTIAAECKKHFTNEFVNPAATFYYGGYGYVTTPAEMQAMIEMALPITGPDPRMELFPMANDEIVIRFASIYDGTNFNIKVDTTAL